MMIMNYAMDESAYAMMDTYLMTMIEKIWFYSFVYNLSISLGVSKSRFGGCQFEWNKI